MIETLPLFLGVLVTHFMVATIVRRHDAHK